MPSVVRRVLFVSALVLAILACNLPIATPPAPSAGAAYTSAAQTVAVAVNQTLLPSMTAPPTSSFTPPAETFTPLPTLSPTQFFTATSPIPLLSVTVDTNCRVGPGKLYDYLGGLYVGQMAEIYGKNSSNNYWYIRLPENPNIFCWVTGQYATLVGNTALLPVFTPPPTPTPVPGFVMAYVGLDSCVGWWVELRLKNTGFVAFKSMSISVKDLDTGTTLTDIENGFTDLGGCMSSSTIASLDPGNIYTISSPAFIYNPDNHKMRATVTLCTLINQGGQCISNTINFKP
jgi:hypothetical protein